MSPAARVASLHVYPIKSCRGIDLPKADVERYGFTWDRSFMVTDADGTFRSQRKDPRLATVETELTDSTLELRVAGFGATSVALESLAHDTRLPVRVHKWEGAALDQGDEIASFFTELLGAPSRFVHKPDDIERTVNPAYARTAADGSRLADAYPFLVTTTASLAALQAEMEEVVPMNRFRPNIVLDDTEPWAEDTWDSLTIGDTELLVTKACTRCAITTTDQRTGERNREPLRTLGRLRKTDSGVTFGIYCVPREPGATIHTGDAVTITARAAQLT